MGTPVLGLKTLKKRAQFLRLRGGSRWATPAFVLETKPRHEARAAITDIQQKAALPDQNGPGSEFASDGPPQFGITVTKRIGNAVTRNLIRRRLKEALRILAKTYARPGYDYVLIARQEILRRDFAQLTRELKTALERVHAPRSKKSRNKASHTSRPPDTSKLQRRRRPTDQRRPTRKT